ncbi:hypothetical protein [Novosphingopyxis sp.]|uniref:hypothetical protein n=1 Tax=Novosphingopyxis sp. TaxID=2709690 RepID=UPI003B597300
MTDRRRFEFRYVTDGGRAPDFAETALLGTETRTDIYLLRPVRPDLLSKLRGNKRLQVKRLLAWAGPLQYWGMPLDHAWSGTDPVMTHLLPGLPIDRGPEQLLDTANHHNDYRVITVAKKRRLFQLGDVRAEITTVRAGDRSFQTIGFEADQAAALIAMLVRYKIADRSNRDYGKLLA